MTSREGLSELLHYMKAAVGEFYQMILYLSAKHGNIVLKSQKCVIQEIGVAL